MVYFLFFYMLKCYHLINSKTKRIYKYSKSSKVKQQSQHGKREVLQASLFRYKEMKQIEVYIKFKTRKDKKQEPACICLRNNKRCPEECEKDKVEYDEYRGWQEQFRNRYKK